MDKIGVYICTGCEIGESLDINALSKVVNKEYKIPLCKTHEALCNKEGLELIKKDIEENGLNKVIIAACSPRVNFDKFSFDPTILERINLREQVVWSHPKNDEDTQMLAEDYMRMGIVKCQKTLPIEPHIDTIERTVLVVGGGIAGITAALEIAKTDYNVVLVEKENKLGGFARKLYKQYPKKPPYKAPEDTGIIEKIKELENHPKVKIYLSSHIEQISGQPGLFDVTLKHGETTSNFLIGSIILSTGFRPYDANKLEYLGYGKYPNVVTNVQMEEFMRSGKIKRPSDNKEVTSIAFVQCAGSRDKDHLPYCSSFCCLTSLKQAMYLRNQSSDAKAYIFYKDMRTPGQYEIFYKQAQNDIGTFLTKGEVVTIEEDDKKNLILEVKDTLLGESINVKADMVVIATGMVPSTLDTEILNLTYRQGKDLPAEKYGFPDSNFICFPYETKRTGIYAVGTVRHPMDIQSCMADAKGAAMKAIQCIELLTVGATLHPRAGDLSYPEFFLQRCTQCKRCTEECPFGTLDEDEKGTPKTNPNRCRRCGVCMGACPERIVSFKNYSVDMIASMIKAIEVPDEDEEKPRMVGFVCENDAYPVLDMAGFNRLQYSSYIRFIPLRCLGSVNIVWIADSLSKGIDGVLLLGCKYGDDYQCHFIKGSELANYRMSKVQETLDRLVLESDRIRILQLTMTEYDKIPSIINDFTKKIEEVGPNPYKGM